VIIIRVIGIKALLPENVHKKSVDALVRMGWFQWQIRKADNEYSNDYAPLENLFPTQ